MTGLVMEPGPVVGVRRESPADKAGFREGDVLVSMAGADLGDPLTLGQRLLSQVGQPVEFGVRREGVAEPVLLRATPVPPASFQDGFSPGSPVGVECLGLAFHLTNVIREVIPDSPAAKAGLRAGDKLVAAVFTKDGKPDGEPVELVKGEPQSWLARFVRWLGHVWRLVTGQAAAESDVGKDLSNWYFVHSIMNLVPDSNLELSYCRGADAARNGDHRTLLRRPVLLSRTAHAYQAVVPRADGGILVGGLVAGLRRNRSQRQESVRGPPTLVHGPHFVPELGRADHDYPGGGFGGFGRSGAAVGVPDFPEPNLAVLNFLPIPALDGGHMLFLIAEGVRGKPLNERLQVTLTLIGVGCLLSLMVLVFTLDIQRFF